MDPADEFVEEFVGADRALKRLALQRVRDIDLWKVAAGPRRRADRRGAREVRRRRLDYRAAGRRRRPPAGLAVASARCTGERVPRASCARRAEPIIELDDILRDALGRPAGRRDPLRRRWSTAAAAWSACSRIDVIAHALHDPGRRGPHRAPSSSLTNDRRRPRPGPDPRAHRRRTASPRTASARTGSPTTSTSTGPAARARLPDVGVAWRSASRSRSRWRCSPTAGAG